MKKALIIIALVGFFNSCQKDYNCACTITDTDPDDFIDINGSADYGIGKQSKKSAESACEVYEETDSVSKTECTVQEL